MKLACVEHIRDRSIAGSTYDSKAPHLNSSSVFSGMNSSIILVAKCACCSWLHLSITFARYSLILLTWGSPMFLGLRKAEMRPSFGLPRSNATVWYSVLTAISCNCFEARQRALRSVGRWTCEVSAHRQTTEHVTAYMFHYHGLDLHGKVAESDRPSLLTRLLQLFLLDFTHHDGLQDFVLFRP